MQHAKNFLTLLGKEVSTKSKDTKEKEPKFNQIIRKVAGLNSAPSWNKKENCAFLLSLANRYTKKFSIKKIPLDKNFSARSNTDENVLVANTECDFAEDFFKKVYDALGIKTPSGGEKDPMHVDNPLGRIISKFDELTDSEKKKITDLIEATSTNVISDHLHKKSKQTYFEKRDAEKAYSPAAQALRNIYSTLNTISFANGDYKKTIENALDTSASYDYTEFNLTHEFLTHVHKMLNTELDSVDQYVAEHKKIVQIITAIEKSVDELQTALRKTKTTNPTNYDILWDRLSSKSENTQEHQIANTLYNNALSKILSNVKDVIIKTADPEGYITQFNEQAPQSDNTDENRKNILKTLEKCPNVLKNISTSVGNCKPFFSQNKAKDLATEVEELNTFIKKLTENNLEAMPTSISDHLKTFDKYINQLYLEDFDSIKTFISSLQTFCDKSYSDTPIDYSPLTKELQKLISDYTRDQTDDDKATKLYKMPAKIIDILTKKNPNHYDPLPTTLQNLREKYLKHLKQKYYCTQYDYQDFDNAFTTINEADLPKELKEQLTNYIKLADNLANNSNKRYIDYLKEQKNKADNAEEYMPISEQYSQNRVRAAQQYTKNCVQNLKTAIANRNPRLTPS